jgi:hypothetical protein
MIAHGFDMHRVFISAPGDLGKEQDTCRGAIGEVNEKEAMPHKALLVSVGLIHDDQIVGYRSAVADNIRQCAFFIQVFEDDWGPKNLFRKMFFLATECLDDNTLPMRDIAVFLKAAPRETDPEILAFRKELQERQDIRIFHFEGIEGLKEQLLEVSSGWVRSILGAAAGE